MSRVAGGLLALLAVAGALLGAASPEAAATFTVTKTPDSADGSCDAADCSLREAVLAANAVSGADVVTVPAGTYTLTIDGSDGFGDTAAAGDLDVAGLTIDGAGALNTFVDGVGAKRPFDATGTVEINGLTVQHGRATLGGGIRNAGTLTLTAVAVSANDIGTGFNAGGGIYSTGSLTLVNSTVSGNTAFSGAGISNASGTLAMTNSTVSGNTAINRDSGTGNYGGINNNGPATITNSTIAANSAPAGQGGGLRNSVPATLKNTIMAQNAGGDCLGPVAAGSTHNLDSDASCGFVAPTDRTGDPKLGPLQPNDGQTATHALLADSPALDAGTSDGCPATDQRNAPRPQGPLATWGRTNAGRRSGTSPGNSASRPTRRTRIPTISGTQASGASSAAQASPIPGPTR